MTDTGGQGNGPGGWGRSEPPYTPDPAVGPEAHPQDAGPGDAAPAAGDGAPTSGQTYPQTYGQTYGQNYGQPAPDQNYGQPAPDQGYGQPTAEQGYEQPTAQQGYGSANPPASDQGYGSYNPPAPDRNQGYGSYDPPPPDQSSNQGYGSANPSAPDQNQGYGPPTPNWAQPTQQYGAPTPGGYGGDQQATTAYDYGSTGAPTGYGTTGNYGAPGNYGATGGYGAPGAPGNYGAPGATGDGTPPPKGRSKGKLALVLGVVVVVVVGLGVSAWALFLRGGPAVTWQGKEVANADALLTQGQSGVATLVSDQKGASNGDTRCYYAVPRAKPSSGKDTDVTTTMYCGPALFVDGDPGKAYVAYGLQAADASGGKVNLSLAGDPDAGSTVPGDVKLVRPDGRTAPSGSGGLKVPVPPPADKDVLIAADGIDQTLPAAPDTAVMASLHAGVHISELGPLQRYGSGADARSAPTGEKLIGFVLEDADGDNNSTGAADMALKVSVDGGTGRAVPDPTGSNVVAVPTSAKTVDLTTSVDGVTQTLSLLDGKPGAGNIAVLARDNRTGTAAPPATMNLTLTGSSGPAQVGVNITGTQANLFYWYDPSGTASASAPDKAVLEVPLDYKLATALPAPYTGGAAGDDAPIQDSWLTLTLPDGSSVPLTSKADYSGFEVPAGFTTGTLTISGQVTNSNGINIAVTTAVSIPISVS